MMRNKRAVLLLLSVCAWVCVFLYCKTRQNEYNNAEHANFAKAVVDDAREGKPSFGEPEVVVQVAPSRHSISASESTSELDRVVKPTGSTSELDRVAKPTESTSELDRVVKPTESTSELDHVAKPLSNENEIDIVTPFANWSETINSSRSDRTGVVQAVNVSTPTKEMQKSVSPNTKPNTKSNATTTKSNKLNLNSNRVQTAASGSDYFLSQSRQNAKRTLAIGGTLNGQLRDDHNGTGSNYLKLINTVHYEGSHSASNNKNISEDVIRRGLGLRPITTKQGAGWFENGVVFEPNLNYGSPNTSSDSYPMEYDMSIPFDESAFFERRKPPSGYNRNKKTILWYTKTRYGEHREHPSPLTMCPDFPCTVTTNRSYATQSAAMIFTAQILDERPPPRKRGQMFILHNHEPPYQNQYFQYAWQNGFNRSAWKAVFNWTMTYRMDSDFVVPYGVVRKRPSPLKTKDYKSIVGKKTKLVAWLVSNCQSSSERTQYVRELQKYIPVDVYGKCGKYTCPYSQEQKCSDNIETNYKFYLSFESSLCTDYITEKFFRYLTMDIVVIARGSNEYHRHAPRDIFLNTADFASPEKLAQRLYYLHKNDVAYTAILRKKDEYMTYMEEFPIRRKDGVVEFITFRVESIGVCNVCQRLWNLDKYAKAVPDIHQWFNQRACRPPRDLVQSKSVTTVTESKRKLVKFGHSVSKQAKPIVIRETQT